ncbi:MAG: nicotinamide-nucleotide amidohydrolase family protein [Elusimicrobia bacterium]|nr:nicotinamide-nucleotide amidohydrolase family protein [Elusimicrobiota bacterium]
MDFKKAELICTGSELISGKINRYVPLFSGRLGELGFRIAREHSVGDDLNAVAGMIKCALKNADLVLTCGGLGATFDDVTRQAAALALGRRLAYSKYAEQILKADYGMKELPANACAGAVSKAYGHSAGGGPAGLFGGQTANFKNQCLIIDGAKMAKNANGTAFGQIVTSGRKMLVILPGPRNEWEPMFDAFISDEIREFFKVKEGTVKTLRLKIAGLWEAQAETLLRPVMRKFKHADYTILAGPYTAEFSFTVKGKNARASSKKISAIEKACRRVLKDSVYGSGDETLEGTVGRLLEAKGATLSAAESCTGGALGSALTDVPGSSGYFMGGVTAYSNRVKERLLGVGRKTILKHGAVSGECAAEMAEGAKRLFKTDYAVAVTGIAGPGGGTEEKPVGLVHFAVTGPGGKTRRFTGNFRRTRTFIKRCAVNAALDALRKIIQ